MIALNDYSSCELEAYAGDKKGRRPQGSVCRRPSSCGRDVLSSQASVFSTIIVAYNLNQTTKPTAPANYPHRAFGYDVGFAEQVWMVYGKFSSRKSCDGSSSRMGERILQRCR